MSDLRPDPPAALEAPEGRHSVPASVEVTGSPPGIGGDPQALGERFAEIVEREAALAEEGATSEEHGPNEPPADEAPRQNTTQTLLAEMAEETGLRFDPECCTCSTCDGHGHVLTGSLVEGNTTRTCGQCSGAGYIVRQTSPGGAYAETWRAPTAQTW